MTPSLDGDAPRSADSSPRREGPHGPGPSASSDDPDSTGPDPAADPGPRAAGFASIPKSPSSGPTRPAAATTSASRAPSRIGTPRPRDRSVGGRPSASPRPARSPRSPTLNATGPIAPTAPGTRSSLVEPTDGLEFESPREAPRAFERPEAR